MPKAPFGLTSKAPLLFNVSRETDLAANMGSAGSNFSLPYFNEFTFYPIK